MGSGAEVAEDTIWFLLLEGETGGLEDFVDFWGVVGEEGREIFKPLPAVELAVFFCGHQPVAGLLEDGVGDIKDSLFIACFQHAVEVPDKQLHRETMGLGDLFFTCGLLLCIFYKPIGCGRSFFGQKR